MKALIAFNVPSKDRIAESSSMSACGTKRTFTLSDRQGLELRHFGRRRVTVVLLALVIVASVIYLAAR